ncbi:MAG: hypothetical protein IJH14_06650 [Solobacterium sp.]|nr:hypothetical protein [Solobacterium sp.]
MKSVLIYDENGEIIAHFTEVEENTKGGVRGIVRRGFVVVVDGRMMKLKEDKEEIGIEKMV